MNLWGGRFEKPADTLVKNYTISIQTDWVLAKFDVQGSIAHAKMLKKCKLIPEQDADNILKGLLSIQKKLEDGQLEPSLNSEDIHSYIEAELYKEIGNAAGNLHLGRSRNDQVALDMHLYLREKSITIVEDIKHLTEALLVQADANIDSILPGYTHLQHAEPIRFAHHLLAYCCMFERDAQKLIDGWKRCNISPLGAGALAGSAVQIDRNYTAELLHFDACYENSMDAVSDRDFIVEFLSIATCIAMHISKLSEEIILWCTNEFNFIELDDAFCTGSSMLPQKKNPDIAELARGRSGRVYGALVSLLTTLKGLPLAYNRDLQEDKLVCFDAVEIIHSTLHIFDQMISTMKVHKDAMLNSCTGDFSNATEIANYLVRKGIPFRESHGISGKIVLHCIHKHTTPEKISLAEYKAFSDAIENDIYNAIQLHAVVEAHSSGTARDNVLSQIAHCKQRITVIQEWITNKSQLID